MTADEYMLLVERREALQRAFRDLTPLQLLLCQCLNQGIPVRSTALASVINVTREMRHIRGTFTRHGLRELL